MDGSEDVSRAGKPSLSLDIVKASRARDQLIAKWPNPETYPASSNVPLPYAVVIPASTSNPISQPEVQPAYPTIPATSENTIHQNGSRFVSSTPIKVALNGFVPPKKHPPESHTSSQMARLEPANPKLTSAPASTESSKQESKSGLSLAQRLLSWRYCIVWLLQSSYVVTMFLTNCLPMAMVCMVAPRAQLPGLGGNDSDPRNVTSLSNTTTSTGFEFHWDAEVQGLVLTSHMFSGFLAPMLGNVLKARLGSKRTMSLVNVICTTLTFLTPWAARISPYCLMGVRVVFGLTQGANVPVIGDYLAWWAPDQEKLTMVALVATGVNIGTLLGSFLSGFLCLVPLDHGWPFVFYTFGTLSGLWGVSWYFLSAAKPEEHPHISPGEKQYIQTHRSGLANVTDGKVKTPYRSILTSVPVLIYVATGTCHVWAMLVLFTYLPLYVHKRLQFSVQDTGLIVSLTTLCRMLGSFMWAALGNKTVPLIGTNRSRKLCIGIGYGLAGITLFINGFIDDSQKWLVLGLLIFVMVNQAAGSSIVSALPLDMAPRYAGLLSSLFASIGLVISVSGPLATAAITANDTQQEWRTVWFILGAIFLTGAAIFVSFGQAKRQPWAMGQTSAPPHVAVSLVDLGRRFADQATPERLPEAEAKHPNGPISLQDISAFTSVATNSPTSLEVPAFFTIHLQQRSQVHLLDEEGRLQPNQDSTILSKLEGTSVSVSEAVDVKIPEYHQPSSAFQRHLVSVNPSSSARKRPEQSEDSEHEPEEFTRQINAAFEDSSEESDRSKEEVFICRL